MFKNFLIESITEYEKAHDVARINAAKPTEQGGLGLPENNTAMDRAKAMGFKGNYYRGSVYSNLVNNGVYLTGDIDYANKFGSISNGNVMKLMSRHSKPFSPNNQSYIEQIHLFPDEINKLKDNNYDSIEWVHSNRMDRGKSGWGNDKSQFYILHPHLIRSIHAAFDPFLKNKNDLLA